ncbi:hypothetical protein ColTof3_07416 [Colletotrichum tofieldiae]|nr:hypothetical protein ColTof3_07416 [Colletotrichum tofieldiae]
MSEEAAGKSSGASACSGDENQEELFQACTRYVRQKSDVTGTTVRVVVDKGLVDGWAASRGLSMHGDLSGNDMSGLLMTNQK